MFLSTLITAISAAKKGNKRGSWVGEGFKKPKVPRRCDFTGEKRAKQTVNWFGKYFYIPTWLCEGQQLPHSPHSLNSTPFPPFPESLFPQNSHFHFPQTQSAPQIQFQIVSFQLEVPSPFFSLENSGGKNAAVEKRAELSRKKLLFWVKPLTATSASYRGKYYPINCSQIEFCTPNDLNNSNTLSISLT